MDNLSLIIGADVFPTETNFELFSEGNIKELIGEELKKIWEEVDFRIFNLEGPLTDKNTPIEKSGPNIKAPTNTINGIKEFNPSLITLANNHILDYGEEGLISTIDKLTKIKIPYIGAGMNEDEAMKPYILNKNGINVGIYSCAEHEFSIVSNKHGGANPFNALETFDNIYNLKKTCDYVVVLYHGGSEHYRYPSPQLQKVFRKMSDKGADVVIAQHTHCVGCYEEYNESLLIYGQGNFLFDGSTSDYWKTGLLVRLDFSDKLKYSFIPIVKKNNFVRLAKDESKEILEGFSTRSEEICSDNFIEDNYKKYADEMIKYYLTTFHGLNFFTRAINKVTNGKIWSIFYGKRSYHALMNSVNCESHRELLLKGLEKNNKYEVKY